MGFFRSFITHQSENCMYDNLEKYPNPSLTDFLLYEV